MFEFNPLKSNSNFHTKLEVVSMWRIICARLFDICAWLLILFGFWLIFKTIFPRKNQIIILYSLFNFQMLLIFGIIFVIIPTFYRGQTIGRRIFQIQIIKAKTYFSLPFHYFLLRELFLVLLPFVVITSYLIIIAHFWPKQIQTHYRVTLLLPIWFGFLFIFQKINPNQQIFIDRYFDTWIVNRQSKRFNRK